MLPLQLISACKQITSELIVYGFYVFKQLSLGQNTYFLSIHNCYTLHEACLVNHLAVFGTHRHIPGCYSEPTCTWQHHHQHLQLCVIYIIISAFTPNMYVLIYTVPGILIVPWPQPDCIRITGSWSDTGDVFTTPGSLLVTSATILNCQALSSNQQQLENL